MKKEVEEKIGAFIDRYKLTLERAKDEESTGATSPAKSSAPTQEGAPSAQPQAKDLEHVVAKSEHEITVALGQEKIPDKEIIVKKMNKSVEEEDLRKAVSHSTLLNKLTDTSHEH